ncbi:MAG: hypothetical protein J6Q78_05125 [Clostridia bacterium]|nr:hypothetical protein [Clostridia bacterium]
MKKIVCLLLLLATLFSFAACADTDSEADSNNNSKTHSSSNDKNGVGGKDDPDDTNSQDTQKNDDNDQNNDSNADNSNTSLVACLTTLLSEYKWSPKSVIPCKLRHDYEPNLLTSNQQNINYEGFVSVSDIPKNGIGEQWNMVTENLSEAQIFFNTLSVVDNLSTASVAAFEAFLDDNPSDTAHYQFEEGIYSVTIHCTPMTIEYVLDYTTNIPALGNQSIQIALSMNIPTKNKDVRVQIGDANAIAYTITQNKYTFAIKYLDLKLGSRSALFEIVKNSDNTVTGHIYEYITVSSLEYASVADFYITDDYVTVVGNKASGIVGFEGYICELYSVASGKMIAYEVKEEMKVSGVGVTYNTIWFDIDDVAGLTSIKHIPADPLKDEDKKIYVNGSSSVWETKNYGISGGAKFASRRFDIEFRTQYFYYYDSENEKYEKVEIEVPMLFVQEEVYDDLIKDVKNTNNITISIKINTTDLSKLMSEYDSKIDLPRENKEKYSSSAIIEFIGNKIIFTK